MNFCKITTTYRCTARRTSMTECEFFEPDMDQSLTRCVFLEMNSTCGHPQAINRAILETQTGPDTSADGEP